MECRSGWSLDTGRPKRQRLGLTRGNERALEIDAGREQGPGIVLRICALLALACLVLGVTGSAVAATGAVSATQSESPTEVTISGTAEVSTCNDGNGWGALEFSGDLEGCLTFYVTDSYCEEVNGFAHYTEAGMETFQGTYAGEQGEFVTEYTLEATFLQGSCDAFAAGEFPAQAQLTGGCNHEIHGRTGAFSGLDGFVNIHDVIASPGESGATSYNYVGRLAPSTDLISFTG